MIVERWREDITKSENFTNNVKLSNKGNVAIKKEWRKYKIAFVFIYLL